MLFGDSHAAQWLTPVEQIAKANRARLVMHLKSSCAVADVPVKSFRLRRAFHECLEWRRQAVTAIIKLQPAAVIISEFSAAYVKLPNHDDYTASVTADEWSNGLRRTLLEFQRANIAVVVIADTPNMGFNVPTCLARAEYHGLPPLGCQQTRETA